MELGEGTWGGITGNADTGYIFCLDVTPEQIIVELYHYWVGGGDTGSRKTIYIKLSNDRFPSTRSFEVAPGKDKMEQLNIRIPKYRNGKLVTYTFTVNAEVYEGVYTTQYQMLGRTTGISPFDSPGHFAESSFLLRK